MMRNSFLLTLILLLLLSACGQQAGNLEPATLQHIGYQASLPADWNFQERGTYYRGPFPQDPTGLLTDFFPGLNADQTLQGLNSVIFQPLGLDIPTEPNREHTSSGCTWKLYQFTVSLSGANDTILDLALAEVEDGTLAVGFTASQQEYSALFKSTFLPILDSFEPLDFSQRSTLAADELLSPTSSATSPVHNNYFTPLGDYAPSLHTFEGKLTVPEFTAAISLPPDSGYPAEWAVFPGFTADFFTYQDYLIPVQQGILPASGSNSAYQVILSPGKIWSESGDNHFSRAAFPFALVFPNTSDTYNGLATFLFDDQQVSSFYFQVVQETAGNPFELWGQSPMEYQPAAVSNLSQLQAQFETERDAMLPVEPWQTLEAKYPNAPLDQFSGSAYPLHNSATGIFIEDTIYLQTCQTRYGPFPFCEYMRHGSFSLSKSLGSAVAMLWLAEKYGPEVFDLRIADYVEIDTEHDGWEQVTFGDALNQATGIGDAVPKQVWPNPILADEDGEDDPKFAGFISANTTDEKASVCASYGNHPWGPGEVVRYNSCNTFYLSIAMDNYLKSIEGAQADLWEMLTAEVFQPLGIGSIPIQRTIEPDDSRGIPILAWGMYPTYQDAMKIAQLLLNHGQHLGQQLLHAERTTDMIHITPDTGLPSGEFSKYGQGSYHMSLWTVPYKTADDTLYQIPYMSGWGGNRVIFTPNGLVSFRFTDSHDYNALPLVTASEAIQAFGAP
jgi:hypothetical protein